MPQSVRSTVCRILPNLSVKVKIEQKTLPSPQLKVDTLLLVDNKDDKLQYNDDDFIQTQVTNFLLLLRHSQQIPLRRTPLFRPQAGVVLSIQRNFEVSSTRFM
ncbi:unnamed protein product [Lactuca virosa]|uniref:Uncharacterized protein n=1 Tax=Lactuca virosa TaxID=75947 RepID=A0AAU9MXN2_9ASTR|nr:unnamed protein product [Lactuca virosa]